MKLWKEDRLIMPKFLLLVCAVFIFSVKLALAHDFWISPSDYKPVSNTEIGLDVRVGQNFQGDSLPRIDDWFTRFEIMDAKGLRNVEGFLGDDPAGSVKIGKSLAVIIYQSNRTFVELDAEKFESYLRDEALENIIELRRELGEDQEKGREWFSRYAKTLIKPVGAVSTGSDHDFAMTLEIVPLQDPYRVSVGDDLSLRLIYLGKPLSGIQLVAYNVAAPTEKKRVYTDINGKAEITLNRDGEWLVKAVHMIRAPVNKEGVDWESFWASLTFDI